MFSLPRIDNGYCTDLVIGSVTARDPAGITGVAQRPFQISSMIISGHSRTAMHAAIIMVALFALQPVSPVVLPLGMGHLLVLQIAVSLLLGMSTSP